MRTASYMQRTFDVDIRDCSFLAQKSLASFMGSPGPIRRSVLHTVFSQSDAKVQYVLSSTVAYISTFCTRLLFLHVGKLYSS
jgi:hypothetical protein